jgi:hypothetical protein
MRTSMNFLAHLCELLPSLAIYRHGGHDGWSTGSSDITVKGNPLGMIQAQWFKDPNCLE